MDQDQVPYVDALLRARRAQPGQADRPRAQGRRWRRPRDARGAGSEGARHGSARPDRGHRRRASRPQPLRAGAAARRRRLGSRSDLVPRRWRLAGKPRRPPCPPAHGSQRRHAAERPLERDRRLGPGRPRPTFIAPEIDPELGVAHCPTPDALEAALDAAPDAVGALVVSPTYFGACADIAALVEICHSRGLPLIVDEAWGAHLTFSDELPQAALAAGADLVISSTHKIIGSLTQSAMIHLGHDSRIDGLIVDRVVTLLESTSPSSLLTLSLDAARRMAAVHGAGS